MANYTDGSITIIEGLNTVVGKGTAFKENVAAGQFLTIAGLNRPYQISEVVDDTHLRLTRRITMTGDPRTRLRLEDQVYSIIDSFTPNISIPFVGKDDVNKQPRMARAVETIDTAMGTVLGWQKLRDAGLL